MYAVQHNIASAMAAILTSTASITKITGTSTTDINYTAVGAAAITCNVAKLTLYHFI